MKKTALIMLLAVAVAFVAGCASGPQPILRCQYEPGQQDIITYDSKTAYASWIEMPDKDPAAPDGRVVTSKVVLGREVTDVDSSGNATMLITFKQAHLDLKIDVRDTAQLNVADARKKTHKVYADSGDSFRTDFTGEPKLSGQSFTVKVAPDTAVLEISGLEQLRSALNLQANSEGIVAEFIREDSIKNLLQAAFIMAADTVVANNILRYTGETEENRYEQKMAIPNDMIAGTALLNQYYIEAVQQQGDDKLITIATIGLPIYGPLAGFTERSPDNFMQKIIKDNSEMSELLINGESKFLALSGRLLQNSYDIDCMLVLDGNKITMGQTTRRSENPEPGSGGYMFTQTKINNSWQYEIIQ